MEPTATRPLARTEKLLVQQMGDETLVYDLEGDRAYCLNRTSAVVWRECDGKTTVEGLAAKLQGELGAPAGADVVWMALEQLRKSKLLKEAPARPQGLASPSRRRLLKMAGGAALLLPVVASVVAPTPAYASTCRGAGASCNTTAECCNGLICMGNTCQPL